ncbi:MAG: hypothetical protein J6N70_17780 [Oribacterium sp.]|nr:hypothetical protein [Oribacterium sp.]
MCGALYSENMADGAMDIGANAHYRELDAVSVLVVKSGADFLAGEYPELLCCGGTVRKVARLRKGGMWIYEE